MLGSLSKSQAFVAVRLRKDAHSFARANGGEMPALGRGRARLADLLLRARVSYGEVSLDKLACVAEEVDIKRIKSAGICRASGLLPPERRMIVKDLHQLVNPQDLWPTVRPCHRVPAIKEEEFVRKLVGAKMGILMEERLLPTSANGKTLVGVFSQ